MLCRWIKPNRGFKGGFISASTDLGSQIVIRPCLGFSFRCGKLGLQFLSIASDDEEPAMLEPPRELRRLVRRHFQLLGANLLCSVKLTAMPPEKILERVTVENIEAMAREFRVGVPVVLVLSHLGTWELFAQLMPNFVGFVRNASVYQKLGNLYIDEHVRRTRSQTGLELFDRQAGFQPVIDLLRSGGGVGVLSDQHG